jgi:hypothetical protein
MLWLDAPVTTANSMIITNLPINTTPNITTNFASMTTNSSISQQPYTNLNQAPNSVLPNHLPHTNTSNICTIALYLPLHCFPQIPATMPMYYVPPIFPCCGKYKEWLQRRVLVGCPPHDPHCSRPKQIF